MVKEIHHLSYEETKFILSCEKKEKADLIEVFKILNNLENIDEEIL